MRMTEREKVRAPAVAGMFYEKSTAALRKNIDEMLKRVNLPKVQGTVRVLISPHAGYVYSGFTAAHAFKLLEEQQVDCVIAVGPSHREYFDGISVYSGSAYETPLGKVPINNEVRSELLQYENNICSSLSGHGAEHSLEVQLPFLQSVLREFSFVPIIMGDQRRNLCERLSAALARVMIDRNILLLASSDLSHFHPYEEAVRLDQQVIDEVKRFNSDTFIEKLEKKSFEACGGGPIAVALKTAQLVGATKAEVLHYCNSGDITGDKNEVVGYLAAAFMQVN
jgi:MEMO1 family protein